MDVGIYGVHPRPEYMDYYERTLYKQILGSQNPQSSHGFTTYFVPLNPGASRSYSNDYSSFICCHGTGMENHTKYENQIYSHSSNNETLYVNLFIPSTVSWPEKGFTISQVTNYPREEGSTININGSGYLIIKIRVPFRVRSGYAVRINGTVQNVSANPGRILHWRERGAAVIRLPWIWHSDCGWKEPRMIITPAA